MYYIENEYPMNIHVCICVYKYVCVFICGASSVAPSTSISDPGSVSSFIINSSTDDSEAPHICIEISPKRGGVGTSKDGGVHLSHQQSLQTPKSQP